MNQLQRHQLAYTPQNENKVKNHYMNINSNPTASQQKKIRKNFLSQFFSSIYHRRRGHR
jgi:hypothetical protein